MDKERVILEAKGMCMSFPGVQALDKVDFTLETGTVHALMGENGAGKSTLVKCFMGLNIFDSGKLIVNGKDVKFTHPRQAIEHGISLIEQELAPVKEMTVAENICLGREKMKHGIFLDYTAMNATAEKYIGMLGISIDPTRKMKELSLAEVQLIEIAKALSIDSQILIMDEPTSALGEKEVDILFSVIRKLKAQGKAIIYVSHRMEEIFTITDKITVLRDGKYIGTVATEGTPRAQVITMMIGEKLDENFVKYNKTTETVMMSAEHICQEGIIDDVSLDVRKGEIIGLFGLMGSGRSEFCDAFFGVSKIDSGKFVIEGNDVMINCPKDAMKRDIAYVTEDRKDSGLDLLQSVKYNISLADLQDLSDGFLINKKRENKATQAIVDELSIKTPSLDQLVMNLSGGNQQKVVFGKWIVRKPRILILDEPTRGIDVKAKHEIYKFMSQFADAGKSIIFISSEIPEILMMSDRIFVFNKGKIAARLKRGEANQNNLMYYASVTEKTREYEKNGNGKEFR